MKLYLAGPLFNPGERECLDRFADALEAAGHDCFVPHRQQFAPMDSPTIFSVDSAGLHGADVMVAWLDGPIVDDGTACEIGIFSELVRTRPERYRGIVGLSTDWRIWRQRDAGITDGALNYFVAGAILAHGSIVWSIDEVVEVIAGWADASEPATEMSPAAVVRGFFERMQARDWTGAAALVSDRAKIEFSVTGERFFGRSFVDMNEAYPEGWQLEVVEIIAVDDRIAAQVRVRRGDETDWCAGFYSVDGGSIVTGVEHWVTEGSEPAPEWRKPYVTS